MAIPTGYTLETFSQWLTEEMFFSDTEELGLADLAGGTTDAYKDLTVMGNTTFTPTVNSTYNLNILPSPFAFEQNEEIVFENGIVVQVYSAVDRDWSPDDLTEDSIVTYGDTVLPVKVIAVPSGTDIHDGLRVRVKTADATDRIPNPIINTIMGFALAQMGLNDISQINQSNMYTFRQFAIVEALKVIMQNKVSNYPILNAEDGSNYYGGTLSNQIRNLFEMEDIHLNNYVANLDITRDSRLNILEEGLSANTSVGVVW